MSDGHAGSNVPRSKWAYVAADKVAAMETWPEACIKLDPWPPAELGETSSTINVQLRVMEVDDVQLGHGSEKDRRTILVEPGRGGGRIVTLAGEWIPRACWMQSQSLRGALVVTLWEGHAHREVKEGDSLVAAKLSARVWRGRPQYSLWASGMLLINVARLQSWQCFVRFNMWQRANKLSVMSLNEEGQL